MKIVDNKGKVFGKIHIIDLLILLFILVVLFNVYIYLKPRTEIFESVWLDVTDESEFIKSAIEIGDKDIRRGKFMAEEGLARPN